MKKSFILSIPKIFLLLTLSFCLSSYDEAGHHAVLYAIARNMGYSVKDAALIADASQSLDDHDLTTAYSPKKIWTDVVLNPGLKSNEKPYIINGQVYHALASPENRKLIEQKHIDRINKTMNSNLGDEEKKRLSLIYLGQYLHFVADEVVHPASSTFTGHAFEGTTPDLPVSDETKLKGMMLIMQDKLSDFKGKGTVTVTDLDEMKEKAKDPKNRLSDNLEKVKEVVVNSWTPTFVEVMEKKFNSRDIIADLEKEKEARIVDRLRNELVKMDLPGNEGGELPYHETIPLDINGNPPGVKNSIEDFGFYSAIASLPGLKEERDKLWSQEAHDDKIRLQKFLIKSLGGIALDPDLKIKGNIGKPIKVSLNEKGIVLITSNGEYNFEDIDLQSFATILRTVAAGEIPYVTIGNEPSGKEGYAKVFYSSTLKGTREGNMLFRADIQFKGIFANYPFGNNYELNRPDDPLFNGFPGIGGESLRFWIASDGIILKAEDGYLNMVKSGMQILSETMLQEEVRDDATMNQYTKRLTEHWDEITQKLPEFKNVERLALITSLVSWIRKNRIPVNDAFWTIPPKGGYTPDYSPYIIDKNKDRPITFAGGVTLLPEFKNKGLAYKIQFSIIKKINDYENRYGKGWGRIIFSLLSLLTLFLSIFIPSLVFWLIANWTLKTAGKKIVFTVAVKNTASLLLGTAALTFIISPLTFGNMLPEFDKKLLAFLFTVVASPALFFMWARYRYTQLNSLYMYLQKNKFKKRVATFFFCLFPLFNAILFNSIGTISTSIFGIVPNTRTMALLDFEITPLKTIFLANPATYFKEEDYMTPFVNKLQNYPYKMQELSGEEIDNSGNNIFIVSGDTIDIKNLKPVIWRDNYPADGNKNIFSIDGMPPY